LEKLLREEFRTLEDFRTKEKACEAPEKETRAAPMQAAMHNKADANYGQARHDVLWSIPQKVETSAFLFREN
jgi:hypothetical protein